MRVLLIHQVFASDKDPGGVRHYELARHCAAQGCRFTIVTSRVSYLTGQHKEKPAPRSRHDEPEVLYAYALADVHKSFIRRVLGFFLFMFAALWPSLRQSGIDVVMGTSPPMFQAVTAWMVSVVKRRPFVLEVRDLWPEFAVDMGVLRHKGLIYLSRRLEMFLYRRAAHIVVNSPAYTDYLIAKGIPASKVTLVANGTDSARFCIKADGRPFRKQWRLEDAFLVLYAGALGPANDLATLLQAADMLRFETDIHFLLVGDGKEKSRLQQKAIELQLHNVIFVGTVPRADMPAMLAECDACVATLKDIPMFRTTYPNKVFDYMASARPTVLAIDGVIRQVLEAAGGGVYVPPGNARAMADAVHYLCSHPDEAESMGRSARQYVQAHFERKDQAAQLCRVLQTVAQA